MCTVFTLVCFVLLDPNYFLFPHHVTPSVSISHEEWCWKHKSVEVDVLDADVLGVEFRQIGYILRCSLSHAITLVSNVLLRAPITAANPPLLFDLKPKVFSHVGILPRWQQT